MKTSLVRVRTWLAFASLSLTLSVAAWAQAPAQPAPAQAAPAPSGPKPGDPIRALLVTGGCCHDYNNQALIIPKGTSARANIVWTVANQGGSSTSSKIPLYEDPNWADGFDVIVHNECFADQKDVAWLDRILEPHRHGKPAVLIHCAMHCYRVGNDSWFEFCGVQSPNHGAQYAHVVENRKSDHPIMKGFGDNWTTPNGELYNIIKVFPTCTPLAVSKRRPDNAEQVVVWTNDYHGARVFATTIGHHNDTMTQPTYMNMLTRGVLWAVHGDKAPEIKTDVAKEDAELNKLISQANAAAAPVVGVCCQDGNLTLGRPAESSSLADNSKNLNALDGNMETSWTPANSTEEQWLKVDLQEPKNIRWLRVQGSGRTAPNHVIEASKDGETWEQVADGVQAPAARGARGPARPRFAAHEVNLAGIRYLRVKLPVAAAVGRAGAGGPGAAAAPVAQNPDAAPTNPAPAGGARRGGNRGRGPQAAVGLSEFEAYADKMPDLPTPVEEFATVADIRAPEGFSAKVFGLPPQVNYPVCVTTSENGEVFVGVDAQGSLGKTPGAGKIVRMEDVDGDGKADKITQFAAIDHPRGIVYDAGRMWVLAPPKLVLLVDRDGDGVSDEQKTLIDNITTEQLNIRGADHTTNGIRMGIDGWLYIAVGDFGFVNATGTDGRSLSKRGGGVLRVRPDGSEMEVFAWGLRNIVDVAIDPQVNVFTRDNTNDGGGWNIRVSHIMQQGYYGYPSRFLRFTEEMLPPLAEYGGGSGCGSMFMYDPRWPKEFANALYTCDWGTGKIYRHRPPQSGPSYTADQDEFVSIPRPTDMDLDVMGRLFVTSWKGGSYNYSGENVGFVAQIVPQNFTPKPLAKLSTQTVPQLVNLLKTGSAAIQFHVQHEILRRGTSAEVEGLLLNLAKDTAASIEGRTAGLLTWKQLVGAKGNKELIALAKADATIRQTALKALTDRTSQLDGVTADIFTGYLKDADARVQLQAITSLSRLAEAGKVAADQVAAIADMLLPLSVVRNEDGTVRTTTPNHNQGDVPRVTPHLAVRALVDLGAAASCVNAIGGPNESGAIRALKQMHRVEAVDGLLAKLGKASDDAQKAQILDVLTRLYNKEADYTVGRDWWNTKPDTSGPYYARATWAGSDRIAAVVKEALANGSADLKAKVQASVDLYKVKFDGSNTSRAVAIAPDKPLELIKANPNDPKQIGNRNRDEVAAEVLKLTGDLAKGKALFAAQNCTACHTVEDGAVPKGPHLKDIGKRYSRVELTDSILNPSKKFAQGFESWLIATDDGKIYNGFILTESAETIIVRSNTGVSTELPKDKVEDRKRMEESMMPAGIVNNLTAEQLSDLVTYLESLK